jgi:hypothetical protein
MAWRWAKNLWSLFSAVCARGIHPSPFSSSSRHLVAPPPLENFSSQSSMMRLR